MKLFPVFPCSCSGLFPHSLLFLPSLLSLTTFLATIICAFIHPDFIYLSYQDLNFVLHHGSSRFKKQRESLPGRRRFGIDNTNQIERYPGISGYLSCIY
ncbi:hypothetical protein P167DRAFT_533677 [Morchella conica CCBAS932]|uniref:Uncharacterized protein n=1 Tax=Morchella conica CCBAS932 TaxID=1392247 RepID=A0A3N4KZ56_9PEZI|nr:hypothetical protein P167DRAFT_533677 [Morchella conica CCBAS932]